MTTPPHLSDRYELGETLGFGGMSEVHLARDLRLHRDVAIKVLRADLARDPSFYLRFRREAQNAAALNHPAIVAVYDTGEAQTEYGPLPYIVMEYVDGVTLRDIVHTDGPLPPRRAIEIIADACQALNFSHQNGIIHRDVKPANIMISTTNAVKVMDFGIARAIAAEDLTTTLDPALKKRGFASRDIVSNWPAMAPAPYDKVTRPDKLSWPRGEGGACDRRAVGDGTHRRRDLRDGRGAPLRRPLRHRHRPPIRTTA